MTPVVCLQRGVLLLLVAVAITHYCSVACVGNQLFLHTHSLRTPPALLLFLLPALSPTEHP